MLTDIFAERYSTVRFWEQFGEPERRLIVQLFRLVKEQLFPYWTAEGQEYPGASFEWKALHDKLSMELGLTELSPRGYFREVEMFGNRQQQWQPLTMLQVCESFVLKPYDRTSSPDAFIKERISLIELAFRDKAALIAVQNAALPQQIAAAEADLRARPGIVRIPGNRAEALRATNERLNTSFKEAVHELNERFRRAGANLHYHNGFIQRVEDQRIAVEVEAPFWHLVDAPKWRNVDTDMKEAVDRRDGGDRDPALYAAKALESTIKIISNEKGWSTGNERGAANFIDNLASARSGRFIASWEQDALKGFFSKVRNELGHGPGDEPMPELTPQQTSWAIEACMSWIKSLILRSAA